MTSDEPSSASDRQLATKSTVPRLALDKLKQAPSPAAKQEQTPTMEAATVLDDKYKRKTKEYDGVYMQVEELSVLISTQSTSRRWSQWRRKAKR